MSFPIILQTNLSEPERLDKNLTDVLTVQATMRDDTSVVDPVFLLDGELPDLSAVNYCTVQAFGRSYYVTDMRAVRTGLTEITCHVDVLASYKAQIRANTAIIGRQENLWNLYLNDGTFKVYQDPMVVTKTFPAGFSTQEFVLAVAGS